MTPPPFSMKTLPPFLAATLLLGSPLLAAESPAPPAPGAHLPGGAAAWTLAWSEEFDGPDSKIEDRWISQNSASTHILSSRWRENAVVANGTLKLLNKKEKRGGQDWTSGNIWTREHFQYGYFECRYRYAAAEGTNNSFWIMTTSKPPAGKKSFEIDINEGHYPHEINTNIHNWSDIKVVNGKKTHPSSSKSFNRVEGQPNFARDFHTYGLQWTEKELICSFKDSLAAAPPPQRGVRAARPDSRGCGIPAASLLFPRHDCRNGPAREELRPSPKPALPPPPQTSHLPSLPPVLRKS